MFPRLLVLLTFLSGSVHSQKKDKAVVFYTRGIDTVIIQQYEIDGNTISNSVLSRPNALTLIYAKGMLFSDGNIRELNSKVYRVLEGKFGLAQENNLKTSRDSMIINVNNKEPLNKRFPGKAIVTNEMDASAFFMFPFITRYAPVHVNDSLVSNHVVLSSQRRFTVRRTSLSEIVLGSEVMGYLKVRTDREGRMESMDGTGSSLNYIATVRRDLDFDSITNEYLKRQQLYGDLHPPSVRDTVSVNAGAGMVQINYWRPSTRGRKIFGAVVPWDRFWRTGANHATKLTITIPVYFGGQKVDAGTYSIFTMPRESEWTFMINKKPNVWGTDYDPATDLIRVPMKVEKLPSLVETLTISIIPKENGGTINIDWEYTRASVEFWLRE